jgi:hypothetical protein
MTIPANIHSDDHVFSVDFDAEAWFKQATKKAILGLQSINYRGDYEADAVGEYFERANQQIRDLFKYIRLTKQGFEVVVDAKKAEAWLKKNKPKVWEACLTADEDVAVKKGLLH